MDTKEFSQINWNRNKNVYNQADASNVYWTTAMAAELGEIAGIIQKTYRGFNAREELKMLKQWEMDVPRGTDTPDRSELHIMWKKKMKDKLADEIADLATYLDLFSTANHIDIGEAIKNKFNKVSEEMGAPEYKIN